MADAYEVVAHSVTAYGKGFNHDGNESDGRHWHRGSLVEFNDAGDAAAFLKAGAVKLSSSTKQQAPTPAAAPAAPKAEASATPSTAPPPAKK